MKTRTPVRSVCNKLMPNQERLQSQQPKEDRHRHRRQVHFGPVTVRQIRAITDDFPPRDHLWYNMKEMQESLQHDIQEIQQQQQQNQSNNNNSRSVFRGLEFYLPNHQRRPEQSRRYVRAVVQKSSELYHRRLSDDEGEPSSSKSKGSRPLFPRRRCQTQPYAPPRDDTVDDATAAKELANYASQFTHMTRAFAFSTALHDQVNAKAVYQ